MASNRIPSYRLHKPTGRAVVTLNGRDVYLGKHGTKASLAAYDRELARWMAGGRKSPVRAEVGPTVDEVLDAYWTHACRYYRKDGQPTSMVKSIKQVCRDLHTFHGSDPASEFTPSKLKAIREKWIADELCRSTVNGKASIIKHLFSWAAGEEMIPATVPGALRMVKGLVSGRTEAPDHPPVTVVPDDHLESVLPRLGPRAETLARLQLATGMRPGEACRIRPCDLERSGEVWVYRPHRHKTEHHGKGRIVLIGPAGQAVLRPLLDAPGKDDRYLFPGRMPGQCYRVASYAGVVLRRCRENGVPHWHPNQLRHNAATRIRKEHGIEVARILLGHSNLKTTEIYAEADLAKAARAVAEGG